MVTMKYMPERNGLVGQILNRLRVPRRVRTVAHRHHVKTEWVSYDYELENNASVEKVGNESIEDLVESIDVPESVE